MKEWVHGGGGGELRGRASWRLLLTYNCVLGVGLPWKQLHFLVLV